MTPSDASRVIETAFSSRWTLCPVVYENLPTRNLDELTQPQLFDGSDPFIVLEISPGFSRPITVPLDCVRRYGSLIVTVLTPTDTGSRRVDDIIGGLSSLFQYQDFPDSSGTLRFNSLYSVSRNLVLDGWVRATVQIGFEYDQPLG